MENTVVNICVYKDKKRKIPFEFTKSRSADANILKIGLLLDVATGTKKEKDCQKFIKTHISKLVIPSQTKKNIRKFEIMIIKKMKNRKD